MRGSCGAVQTNLHAFEVQRWQPVGSSVVNVAAVRLELECDTRGGRVLEDVPAMGYAERLAAMRPALLDKGRIRRSVCTVAP